MNKELRDNFETYENEKLKPVKEKYEKYKKQTVIRLKKRKRKRRILTFLTICLFFLILICSIGFYIYGKMKDDINDAIKLGYEKIETLDVDTFHTRYNSQILDDQGNILKEFQGKEYIYKKYDEINPMVLKATVAIEDERFFEHKGIDVKSLMRAGYSTIFKGNTQGGSTITVQLAKNIFMSEVMTQRSIYRKITEWVIAQELEKKYTKEEILEFYVNNINYGSGYYSVASASNYYFQKDTKDLTIAECALLVGIPNNPSLYNPINNPKNAIKRRNIILDKMYQLNIISEKEYKTAKKEELKLNVKKVYIDNTVIGWAETYAMHKATQELMKTQGFLFKYSFANDEEETWYNEQYNTMYQECYQQLANGGYKIITSINKEKQNYLQSIVDSKMARYTETKEDGLYAKQASATLIDNQTGMVVAIVGGRTQDGNNYNRAAFSARQPGSAIKPLVAYAPAYEKGYYPEMSYEDKAIHNGPKNYYSGYIGSTTLRTATEMSINTIPYRLTNEIGVDVCLNYLRNMHFSNLAKEDSLSPIIAIGGFTYGITNVELTSGFAALANNGKFIEPTNVKEIRKISNDTVIYENKMTKTTVYKAGAAYLTTNTLEGVLKSEKGTAKDIQISYPYQAGKTGTTDGAKDLWMAGYTPYYSMSVWVGNDNPAKQGTVNEHKTIWHDSMEWLHQGLEEKGWKRPKSVYEDNGVLKVKIDTRLEDLKKKRNNLELARKNAEIQEQKDRLADLEYRIVYGLSEEEELAREDFATTLIESLESFDYKNLNQKENLHKLYDKIDKALENVKRKSVYNELYTRYENRKNTLENIEYQLEVKAKKERALKEAKENLNDYIYAISNYVTISDYPETDREKMKAIISEAIEAMNQAVSLSELESILQNAKYSLNNFKTIAQIEEEKQQELNSTKENAIMQIKNYVFKSNYRPEEWRTIESLMNNAIDEVNKVNSYDELSSIAQIVETVKTKINSIPTKDNFETTTPPSSSESESETESTSELETTT